MKIYISDKTLIYTPTYSFFFILNAKLVLIKIKRLDFDHLN